jgi:hypothetical protein
MAYVSDIEDEPPAAPGTQPGPPKAAPKPYTQSDIENEPEVKQPEYGGALGYLETALMHGGQGALGGFGDELYGLARAGYDKLSGGDEDFGTAYTKHRDTARQMLEESAAENPITANVSDIGASMIMPTGKLKAAGWAERGIRGMLSGAAQGAVRGAGDAPEMSDIPEQAAKSGLVSGLLGGPLNAIMGPAGKALGKEIPGPTTQELKNIADTKYDQMRSIPVEFWKHATDRVADNVDAALRKSGYRDYNTNVFKNIDELRNPANGISPNMSDIEAVRQLLNRTGKDPRERDAVRIAQSHLDGFLKNVHPTDIMTNPRLAPAVNRLAVEARGDWGASMRAKTIEDALKKAGLGTAATGSGANIDNKIRQAFTGILTNPKKVRGFSAEERQMMQEIIKPKSDVARYFGKFAPSGVISTSLAADLGYMLAGKTGLGMLPLAGYAAKKISDARTISRAQDVVKAVQSRSPTGARVAARNAALPRQETPGLLQRGLQQAGRQGFTPGPSEPWTPTLRTSDYPPNQSTGGRIARGLRMARMH